jgi:transcriptional regulator with XRE-family HTH domain
VRAVAYVIGDILFMKETWRDRIETLLADRNLSMRSVSMRAGLGENYLVGIMREGKDPSIERIIKVADALNVSLAWLLYGMEIGPEEEKLLRLFARLPEKQRRAILDLADDSKP